MVGLAVILPFLGAIALWYLRDRRPRIHWAAAVLLSLIPVLVFIALVTRLPAEFAISNWQPSQLFQAQLQLRLDGIGWAMALAAAALPLSILLCSPARPQAASPLGRISILAYSGLAVVGILASNLVTVIMAWAIADAFGFIVLLGAAESEKTVRSGLRRYFAHLGSLMLLMAGALPIENGLYSAGLRQSFWILAVFLRIGLWPLHVAMPSIPGIRRGLGVPLRLLPPAMGLAFLSRFATGELPQALAWLLLALAALSVLIAGARWSIGRDAISSRPFFALTLSAMAVAAVIGMEEGSTAGAGLVVLLISLGGMFSQLEIYASWHKYLLLVAAVMALGAPWTAGHVLHQPGAFSGGFFDQQTATWLILMLGQAFIAIGIVNGLREGSEPGASGEAFIRNSYAAGLAIPPLVVVLVGLSLPSAASAGSFLLFVVTGALAAGGWYLLRTGSSVLRQSMSRMNSTYRHYLRTPAKAFALTFARGIETSIQGLALFFEGKAALLWVYVVLLIIALFLAGPQG